MGPAWFDFTPVITGCPGDVLKTTSTMGLFNDPSLVGTPSLVADGHVLKGGHVMVIANTVMQCRRLLYVAIVSGHYNGVGFGWCNPTSLCIGDTR